MSESTGYFFLKEQAAKYGYKTIAEYLNSKEWKEHCGDIDRMKQSAKKESNPWLEHNRRRMTEIKAALKKEVQNHEQKD
jgi:GH24 family phage-related lysozyme (muramidase)